jgi:hypothetical protein
MPTSIIAEVTMLAYIGSILKMVGTPVALIEDVAGGLPFVVI